MWDIVLGPLLLRVLGFFFAQCLLARNLYASVKMLCPIFVLDWLNTGPLGLILAWWKCCSKTAFPGPHPPFLSSDPVLRGFGGLLVGMVL